MCGRFFLAVLPRTGKRTACTGAAALARRDDVAVCARCRRVPRRLMPSGWEPIATGHEHADARRRTSTCGRRTTAGDLPKVRSRRHCAAESLRICVNRVVKSAAGCENFSDGFCPFVGSRSDRRAAARTPACAHAATRGVFRESASFKLFLFQGLPPTGHRRVRWCGHDVSVRGVQRVLGAARRTCPV